MRSSFPARPWARRVSHSPISMLKPSPPPASTAPAATCHPSFRAGIPPVLPVRARVGLSDVIVLGAGIVGVCIAIHLQRRGRNVLLVDRREPGRETSYGNAGIIQ